jgi:hypothetical protein
MQGPVTRLSAGPPRRYHREKFAADRLYQQVQGFFRACARHEGDAPPAPRNPKAPASIAAPVVFLISKHTGWIY